MDDSLLINVGITILILVIFGIFLTAYEFREHIIERIKKRRRKK
jgi:glucose uptake protein GlcU